MANQLFRAYKIVDNPYLIIRKNSLGREIDYCEYKFVNKTKFGKIY